MGRSSLRLRQAHGKDLPSIEGLLKRNDLPSDDVEEKLNYFSVASDGNRRIGTGGVELHGAYGLVRSVVIEAHLRGSGYGSALCKQLEANAQDQGVRARYLLTTTAAEFFTRQGYAEIARDDVPLVIRRTTEFTDLCPNSARCLRKQFGTKACGD